MRNGAPGNANVSLPPSPAHDVCSCHVVAPSPIPPHPAQPCTHGSTPTLVSATLTPTPRWCRHQRFRDSLTPHTVSRVLRVPPPPPRPRATWATWPRFRRTPQHPAPGGGRGGGGGGGRGREEMEVGVSGPRRCQGRSSPGHTGTTLRPRCSAPGMRRTHLPYGTVRRARQCKASAAGSAAATPSLPEAGAQGASPSPWPLPRA